MDALQDNVRDLWAYIERELPDNLDELAYETGALLRRKGGGSAASLLRVILTYGVTDLSMKAVSAWATSVKLAELSSVALFYRIRDAKDWLSRLISVMLNDEAKPLLSPGWMSRLWTQPV